MASPATIDLDRLLAPVSEDNPAGADLRADLSPTADYYQLKDARKAARAKERNLGIEEGETADTRSDWRPVFEQSVELLGTRSKDLEVVAWLIESLVRLHGFAGLRDGFRLALAFVERYWESFFPREPEVEDRIAALAGLNGQDAEGTLIFPIRDVPITEAHSVGPFATWQYEQAVSLRQMADAEARERRVAAGAATMDAIDKASLEADGRFLREAYEDLQACGEVFAELTRKLDELCGEEAAPPSSNIKNALNSCVDAVKYVGRHVIVEESDPTVEGEEGVGENGAPTAVRVVGADGMTREQAFQQLLQLADFFRRTEPHSPLSYSIERAVRWGQMPLPELLSEIVTEEAARENLFWLAGITKPDAEG